MSQQHTTEFTSSLSFTLVKRYLLASLNEVLANWYFQSQLQKKITFNSFYLHGREHESLKYKEIKLILLMEQSRHLLKEGGIRHEDEFWVKACKRRPVLVSEFLGFRLRNKNMWVTERTLFTTDIKPVHLQTFSKHTIHIHHKFSYLQI